MKYFYSLAFLVFFFSTNVFAAGSTDADTLFVDSIAEIKPLPTQIFGKPDNQFATMDQSLSLIDVSFKKSIGGAASTSVILMKGGSSLTVWGKKDLSVDSSAGQLTFFYFNPTTDQLEQSIEPIFVDDGENKITVPPGTWEYIEFSLPGAGLGTPNYAKSYMIDAVALIQDTDAKVSVPSTRTLTAFGLQTNYPNPFVANTNIAYSLEQSGAIEIAVVDLAGVEHARFDLGYQNEGLHSEPLAINDRGMYFLRLYVNGIPMGNPLKVISR
jgi:hypothetical protein